MNNSNKLNINSEQQAYPSKPQEQTDYSRKRLMEMTELFAKLDMQDFSQRPKLDKEPALLHPSNLPKFDRQAMTPAKMREACEVIGNNVRQSDWLNQDFVFNTVINFLDYTQKCGGDTFYISDATIFFRGINEERTIGFSTLEYVRSDMRVFIGEYNGTTRAFFQAETENGRYQTAELSEFGMISTFEADGRNLSIITLFDKLLGVELFVVSDSLREKHWPRTDIPANAKLPRNRGEYAFPADYYTTSS